MDINNTFQPNNSLPMRPRTGGNLNYDLQSEKQEIEKITQEIKKELLAKWKKAYANAQIFPAPIAEMHPEVVDFLLSFNLVSVYDNIAKQINLDAKGRSILPRIVWQIAQTKNWNGLDQILEEKIPLVHSAHVAVTESLQQNILDKIKMLSENPVTSQEFVQKNITQQNLKKEIQLPLAEALVKYPKIGEQNITSDQIKLRYFPSPVRPSIKNWITDYHDGMGAMKHSPMDRGNFLFHSENGKTLTALDRQKLGTILKSLDEKTMLIINTEIPVVIFENKTEGQSSAINPLADQAGHQSSNQANIKMNSMPIVRQADFYHKGTSVGRTDSENDNIVKQDATVKVPSYSPNFSIKKPIEEKTQAGIIKSFFKDIVGVKSSSSKIEDQKNETQYDSYKIPESKHQLGSEEYIDKSGKDVKLNSENILSIEKIQNNPFLNSTGDNVIFSSAQKLPVEQKDVVAQPTPMVATPKVSSVPVQSETIKPVPAKYIEKSPYHIVPSDYIYEEEKIEKEEIPKVAKNVVDLKN